MHHGRPPAAFGAAVLISTVKPVMILTMARFLGFLFVADQGPRADDRDEV